MHAARVSPVSPEMDYSHRLVPIARASAEGQLSDLLDPDKLVSWVPLPDILTDSVREWEQNRFQAQSGDSIATIVDP